MTKVRSVVACETVIATATTPQAMYPAGAPIM